MASFTPQQVEQLLRPINNIRVLSDGKGHAHVSQQDITAHLIRVFGFGGFDVEVLSIECLFEHARLNAEGRPNNRWDVGYRALVRLTVRNPDGETVCRYENGSTATAQNQTLGDAHDLAYKSAISLSVKRAAIALGDQFGLSLYNKGQREALVRGTIVGAPEAPPAGDVQEGVPQQLALGHDEVDRDLDGSGETPHDSAPTAPPPPEQDPGWTPTPEPTPRPAQGRTPAAITRPQLAKIGALMNELGMTHRPTVLAWVADTVGRPVESRNDLTAPEAHRVIEALLAEQRAIAEGQPS
jgi:hypothetical protein